MAGRPPGVRETLCKAVGVSGVVNERAIHRCGSVGGARRCLQGTAAVRGGLVRGGSEQTAGMIIAGTIRSGLVRSGIGTGSRGIKIASAIVWRSGLGSR